VNFIELFAGCGGLSLGLKSVGFDLVMANELSPMAAESYAYNFLDEDIEALARQRAPTALKTLWLGSRYPKDELARRRREDPRAYPSYKKGHGELDPDGSNLEGSLVVGSITELNKWLGDHGEVVARLRTAFGKGDLDLVSGGPPCQSFSLAGLRQRDCEKNTLPWEFAKFTESTQPKFVLLENVTGILKPFKVGSGDKFYAWFELATAFAGIGYYPLCLHVNAKYAGVAQNRQRFILIGVREDVYEELRSQFNACERELFRKVELFFESVRNREKVEVAALHCWDVENANDASLFAGSFLSPLVTYLGRKLVSAREAIDDIRWNSAHGYDDRHRDEYSRRLEEVFSGVLGACKGRLQNHDLRNNSDLVQRRFYLYQVLSQIENQDVRRNVVAILNGRSDVLSEETWCSLREFKFLRESGEQKRFRGKEDLLAFLERHRTKKQTQKALAAGLPAPATVSIPDDACHYDELRTLTVRELARLQSFPDRFVFRSKITTGGNLRSFEVPQYTQVGNAVPPLLGSALGEAIQDLLQRLKTGRRGLRAEAVKLLAA